MSNNAKMQPFQQAKHPSPYESSDREDKQNEDSNLPVAIFKRSGESLPSLKKSVNSELFSNLIRNGQIQRKPYNVSRY